MSTRSSVLELFKREIFRQLWRFVITGGLAFILHLSLLILLTELLNVHYLFSTTIAFIVSVIFNYVLSVRWVFRFSKHNQGHLTTFFIFLILATLGLCMNNLMMYIGVSLCRFHYLLTQILTAIIIMFFNFITRKILIE